MFGLMISTFQAPIFLLQIHDLFLILINELPHFSGNLIDKLFDLFLKLRYDFAAIGVFRQIINRGKDLRDGLESFHIILLIKEQLYENRNSFICILPFLSFENYDEMDNHSSRLQISLCSASNCSSALQMPKMVLFFNESSIIQFNMKPSPLVNLTSSVFMPSCSIITSFSTSAWFMMASRYLPNRSDSKNMGPRILRQFQCFPSSSQRAITTNFIVRRIFSVFRRLTSRCSTRRFMATTYSFAFIDSGLYKY